MRAVVSSSGAVKIEGLATLLFTPLADLCAHGFPVPDELLCALFCRLTVLLSELHSASGVAHGAVSPSTVLLTQGGGASLLARPFAPPRRTCYTSPAPHAPGLSGDLFALGCTLHAAAAGGEAPYLVHDDGVLYTPGGGAPELPHRSGAVREAVGFLLRAPQEALKLLQSGRLRTPTPHADTYAPALWPEESPERLQQHAGAPSSASALASLTIEEIGEGLARASPPRGSGGGGAPASPAPVPGRGKALARSSPSAIEVRRQPAPAPAPAAEPPSAEAEAAATEARLARLARLRRDANAGAAAAQEAALAAARLEAFAARRALQAAHVGDGGGGGGGGGGSAAAAPPPPMPPGRAPGALPRSPQQQRPAATGWGSPRVSEAVSAAAPPQPPPPASTPTLLDARARRAAARQAEEERALEAARVAAFQGRVALAARAKELFDSSLAAEVQGRGAGGGGGGGGGGGRTGALQFTRPGAS